MSCFDSEFVINRLKLFWQYPVITEKTFYQQNKSKTNYIGIPWATIIDKKYNLNVIFNLLKEFVKKDMFYYTCCQHISFRKLLPLFKALNIVTVYTPHKIKGENCLQDVQIYPCPLYAVNYEDNTRNETFKDIDFLNIERPILYSFQGAYNPNWYLTDIRKRIFETKHPDNCYVKHIGDWHFEKVVYSSKQNNKYELNETDSDNNRTNKYNKLLMDSRYTLCPSGSGPNSIRFWEALAVGSIPILLADTLELPAHDLWDNTIIRVAEKDLETIPNLLSNITDVEEKQRSSNCLLLYNFFKNNFINTHKTNVPLTCFTSYKCSINEPIILYILNKWSALNPTICFKYFSDEDVKNFFSNSKYYTTFNKMKNGVAIADLFRACYIHKYGGYWFDLDLEPIKLTLPNTGNIHLFDAGFKNISYMFIGASPNQTLFNDIIERVIVNINNNIPNKIQHVMDITGPRIIQQIICDDLKIKNYDGCLVGTDESKLLLQGSNHEFLYTKIHLTNVKTDIYKQLQAKYKQHSYQFYNYI